MTTNNNQTLESIVIHGTAAWARVHTPQPETVQTINGKSVPIPSRYSINVIVDDKTAADLKKRGLNVKTLNKAVAGVDESKGTHFVNIKCNATYKDGNPTPAPKVVDAKLNPVTKLIGNGSTVKVQAIMSPYTAMGVSGISLRLVGVQVLDLIEYTTGASLEFEEESGYVEEITTTTTDSLTSTENSTTGTTVDDWS